MLKVNPSLKKYVDDLVAAEVAALETLVANEVVTLETLIDTQIAAVHPAKIKTGTYTGNGADDHDIDIGVDLAAKDNVWVVIKSIIATEAYHRIEYGQGDLAMRFDVAVDDSDWIQGFTATGFQVGSGVKVNNNGDLYRYIAFWTES